MCVFSHTSMSQISRSSGWSFCKVCGFATSSTEISRICDRVLNSIFAWFRIRKPSHVPFYPRYKLTEACIQFCRVSHSTDNMINNFTKILHPLFIQYNIWGGTVLHQFWLFVNKCDNTHYVNATRWQFTVEFTWNSFSSSFRSWAISHKSGEKFICPTSSSSDVTAWNDNVENCAWDKEEADINGSHQSRG